MRIRTKINIDYSNIIKDDINVKYKKKARRYFKIIKNGNYQKTPLVIKQLLKNDNFRNNQNYILNKTTINNFFHLNNLKLFFKSFALIFFVLSFYLSIFLNNFLYIILFFIVSFFIYKSIFTLKNNIFKIKEEYFNRHFIYIADKK